ncbi:TasA family protein [Thermococcus sp.]|uniref:TasA family protein n=1 Tax=Thermococcus sp. TaxID=35749 RepID=UPI00263410F9|nr:TasA family protein [Thermococcus sp.]
MRRWAVVLITSTLMVLMLVLPAWSIFTDRATSNKNTISSGEFDIGISKDGSRFYNDLHLFDFSDLKPGDSREIVFHVKNRGDVAVSKLTIAFTINDLEDGPLSPAEAKVDHTPDVGELSDNLVVTSMTVEVGGKAINVSSAVGKTLKDLNGKPVSIPLGGKLAPGETAKVMMRVWFSKNAGNECQTDSVSVNMTLDAQQ